MNTRRTIKVYVKDIDTLMIDCKNIYLKAHPELKEISDKLSMPFMFNKVVEYYKKLSIKEKIIFKE